MQTRRSITVDIIVIFLIFNILSIAMFTGYMQKNGKEAAIAYTRHNLLEVTGEKSELLAITFDRIEDRAQLTGMYMEDVLRGEVSGVLDDSYILREDGMVTRQKDENKRAHQQSNIIVPGTTPMSEELIREINVTERLDPYFAQIIENEEVSWCYMVTKENLLRCSPYRKLNEFFTSDHSQVSDIFYTQATGENNPEHQAVWTEPYYDYLGTGWTMTCSQPVYDDDGQIFGVICLDLSIEKVKEKYFDGFSLGETGKICWMSNDGDVYYHTDYDKLTAEQGEPLEKNIFDETLSAGRTKALQEGVLSGNNGIRYFEENGKQSMFVYAQVPRTDSVLFMEISMEDFNSFYAVNVKGVVIVVLINLILAFFFALILYDNFSKPMKRLANQAQKISEGNYSKVEFETRGAAGNNEIIRLNEALRIMNESIVSYMESLRDKNREIHVILEAIDEALMIVNIDGTVSMKSKDSFLIPEDVLQMGIDRVTRDRQPFAERTISEGEVYRNAYYPVLKDGEVAKVVVSSECITKNMLMEKELQQIEKMAGVGQLAAALVHELKNILARIKGAAYILRVTGTEQSKEIERIQQAVDEAENLITTLLDYSARDKNGSEMIHLGTLINQILLLSKKEIIGKGIAISKKIDEDCYVHSNRREAIKVILQNIILNAIQAVTSDGKIDIVCCKNGNDAVIRIKDDGGGISVSPREKIFEPFLTTKTEGTGIGLWIAKRLVDTLNGSIILEQPAGGGTEFIISIPVDRKEEEHCDTDDVSR